MGERATIDQDYLYDIADAIREKKGVTTRFMPPEMKPAILSIPAGVDVEALNVTQNGTYTAPTGKAYSPVTVNVSGGGGTSLQFNLGRLTVNTGEIAESSEYCYSDLIPISQGPGRWFLDLARSNLDSYYIGISFFAQDGVTNVGYIRQYESYRSYQNSSGGNAKYFRIANKVSNLSFASASFLTEGIYVAPQSGTIYRINPA